MSLRVRCHQCRAAFLPPENIPPSGIVCPRCGALHRPPSTRSTVPSNPNEAVAPSPPPTETTVFVPSEASIGRVSRRRWLALGLCLLLLGTATVAALLLWPRGSSRKLDPVERVANDYLNSLVKSDTAVQQRLGLVDDPPAIQSYRAVTRDRGQDRSLKGSFAPLSALHRRIETEFVYDAGAGRFTPKHPLGAAAETLDLLEAAKEEAKKSGVYDKMASGDPDDLFDAAESYGKVFTKLAEGALAPKKLVPTYATLVKEAKPAIPPAQQELATLVGESPKAWEALLKRPFHTLKADGPYILDRAEVNAQVLDRLASLGDPPTTLRLSLVRFRLEGIDTGWRITSARRVPDGLSTEPAPPDSTPTETAPRSLGNPGSG